MQIVERNNWEHRTYYLGEPVLGRGSREGESDNRLTPKNCKALRLILENGSLVEFGVEWRQETHTYSDHGHPGSARSDVPYLRVDNFGLISHVKLSEIADIVKIAEVI